MLKFNVKLKTDENKTAKPALISIVFGILKGYVTHPRFILFGALIGMPKFLKTHKANYPKEFLKTCGLITLLYKHLKNFIGQEKAYEVVRAIMISSGLAVQQSSFKNVEEERTFENLVKFQQRTNNEGPTKLNKMEIIEQSEKRYEFRVTHCMFYEFFSSIGFPELTKLMCSIDNAIFNSYLPEKITFHRSGINNRIADGAEFCSFVIENNEE